MRFVPQTHSSVRRLLVSFTLFFSALMLFSCNYFSTESMTEVITRSVQTMEVVRMDLTGDSAIDCENIRSIPSGEVYSVNYIVKNPMGFRFTAEVTNASDGISNLSQISEPYSWEVSKDYTVVTVNLTNEMLIAMECGGNISPLVQIHCAEYGDSIPEYMEDLRANSRPPLVQCAVLMIDTAFKRDRTKTENSSIGRYVLCFNLPNVLFDSTPSHVLNGIHSDVRTIRIEGLDETMENKSATAIKLAKKEGVDLDLKWDTELKRWTYNSLLTPTFATTISENTYNNVGVNRSNGMPAASFYAWDHPVYIYDSRLAHDGDVYGYKITMKDELGLESTLNVRTDSKQLCPVRICDAYGDDMTMDKRNNVYIRSADVRDEHFDMVLKAPLRTLGTAYDYVDDAEVVYTIYGSEDSSSLKYLTSGTSLHDLKYTMSTGWSYKISAYAHRVGYIDSAITEWNVHVGMETVTVEVLYKAMQYYVGFELDPYIIYPDYDNEQDYTIKVKMKVYDIDRTNAIIEAFSNLSNKAEREKRIEEEMEKPLIYLPDEDGNMKPSGGARVSTGYSLNNFELRIVDIDTEWNDDLKNTLDVSNLSSDYATFLWPKEYTYTPGRNEYQVYAKVEITNLNYEVGDKAYTIANSALLKFTVEGQN